MNGALHLIATFSILAALVTVATYALRELMPCRHKWVVQRSFCLRGRTRVFYICRKCGEQWP